MADPELDQLMPDSSRPAVRDFFEMCLEAAEAEGVAENELMAEATSTIDDPYDAANFVYGLIDKLKQGGADPQNSHRLAIAQISNGLYVASHGSEEALTEKLELWQPVCDAIKTKEELGSSWDRTASAVHFFDQAESRFLEG